MGFKKLLQNSGLITADTEETSVSEDAKSPLTNSASNISNRSAMPSLSGLPLTNMPINVAPTIAPDPEIVNGLVDATTKSKKSGYDKFKINFDALNQLPDAQRYAMALNVTLASKEITAGDILESLDDRLNILDKTGQSYEIDYQQQLQQSVVGVQTEIENIAKTVEQKKKEIQDMEIRRVELTQQAGIAQTNLEREHAVFSVSHDVVKSMLQAEYQRIASLTISRK